MRQEYINGNLINIDESKGDVEYGFRYIAYTLDATKADELIGEARSNGAAFFTDESGYEYILIYTPGDGSYLLQRKT